MWFIIINGPSMHLCGTRTFDLITIVSTYSAVSEQGWEPGAPSVSTHTPSHNPPPPTHTPATRIVILTFNFTSVIIFTVFAASRRAIIIADNWCDNSAGHLSHNPPHTMTHNEIAKEQSYSPFPLWVLLRMGVSFDKTSISGVQAIFSPRLLRSLY